MGRLAAVPVIVLGCSLVGMSSCSDVAGPPPSENSVGLIVSAPVRPPTGAAHGTAPVVYAAAASANVVYVSLPPGSVPTGVRATITNRATGQAISTALVDGGFDPVPIAASVGDTLVTVIVDPTATTLNQVRLAVSSVRPLKVVRTSPPRGGRDVPLNSIMVIVFSTPIDPATLTTESMQLWRGTTPVAGTVGFADSTHLRAEFHPADLLASQTDYQLVVTQAIRDVNGTSLAAPVTLTFSTASTGPTTGNLQVTISGLPVTAAGAVTVSGPGGYSQTVTTSTTLSDLLPGLYTIAARNVWASNATYGPALASQTVPVTASTTLATATVAYAVLPSGWITMAPMPTAREHLAVGVVNGVLYAVGGCDTACGGYLATVEAYDPATNTWTTKAPMPTPRSGLAVGVVNGLLYAVGGSQGGAVLSTVEAYDPATNSWTTRAPMPTARTDLAVGVVNGVLYVVGGTKGGVNGVGLVLTAEAYDPATNSWTTKAPMSPGQRDLAAGVLNGDLYAVGGGDAASTVATVQAYDPTTNSWTTKAPMSTVRDYLAAGVLNGVLYAVGGVNGQSGDLATAETYDLATNSWTTKAPMPTARSGLALGVVNGVLYAVGGFYAVGGSSPIDVAAVEAYTP